MKRKALTISIVRDYDGVKCNAHYFAAIVEASVGVQALLVSKMTFFGASSRQAFQI
jgi:hypothetical protein